jgi:hypothetical protein
MPGRAIWKLALAICAAGDIGEGHASAEQILDWGERAGR